MRPFVQLAGQLTNCGKLSERKSGIEETAYLLSLSVHTESRREHGDEMKRLAARDAW
jgi:hypothetical protein